jgi:hypothetical protein
MLKVHLKPAIRRECERREREERERAAPAAADGSAASASPCAAEEDEDVVALGEVRSRVTRGRADFILYL